MRCDQRRSTAANSIDADTKSGKAYRLLKEKLESGHFSPGERITEVAVAKALSMSRVPIREALMRLEGEGLIESNGARGGKYVACIEDLDPEQVLQQYELREGIEGIAASLAAKNMNGWQIDELCRLNEAVTEATRKGDWEARMDAVLEFHNYLVANCGNEQVYQVWQTHRLMPLRQRSRDVEDMIIAHFTEEDRRRDQEEAYKSIVEAIAARDPEEAGRAARSHVHVITEAIRKTAWSKLRQK